MKVSVLVTFYNQLKYVDTALRSVVSQKCNFEYEIIVGDDGSTDGTYERVCKWSDKYPNLISVYRMSRDVNVDYNASQRASRNRLNLLKYVRGEYFLYLDGDDFYTDNAKLQRQVDILDSAENQDCVMCAHNVYLYEDVNGRVKKMARYSRIMKMSAGEYWSYHYFHPSSIMLRSKYIKQIPYDLVKDYFNDNNIIFCFAKYGGVYYIPDTMTAYRQTGNGIWTGNSRYIGMLRNVMAMDLEYKINPNLIHSSMARHFKEMTYFLWVKCRYVDGKLTYYIKCIKRDRMGIAWSWLRYSLGKKKISRSMRMLYCKSFFCFVSAIGKAIFRM